MAFYNKAHSAPFGYDLRAPYNVPMGEIRLLRVVEPFSTSSLQRDTITTQHPGSPSYCLPNYSNYDEGGYEYECECSEDDENGPLEEVEEDKGQSLEEGVEKDKETHSIFRKKSIESDENEEDSRNSIDSTVYEEHSKNSITTLTPFPSDEDAITVNLLQNTFMRVSISGQEEDTQTLYQRQQQPGYPFFVKNQEYFYRRS